MQHSNEIELLIPADAWFSAPAGRTLQYYPVFSQVSRMLQETLRQAMPPICFGGLSQFSDIEFAYPMLVYAASRPYASKDTQDLTPDLLEPESIDRFFRFAITRLQDSLTKLHGVLLDAGLPEIAAHYDPRNTREILAMARRQTRFLRPIKNILVAEMLLIQELVQLGGCTVCPPRVRAQKVAVFTKRWNSLLRRFYRRIDFSSAAPQLLRAATVALMNAQQDWRDRETAEAA